MGNDDSFDSCRSRGAQNHADIRRGGDSVEEQHRVRCCFRLGESICESSHLPRYDVGDDPLIVTSVAGEEFHSIGTGALNADSSVRCCFFDFLDRISAETFRDDDFVDPDVVVV